jgi:hypothetical protein
MFYSLLWVLCVSLHLVLSLKKTTGLCLNARSEHCCSSHIWSIFPIILNKTFSFHTLNGYWRYKSEVYLWIILTILTNDFDKLDTFIRWRTRSDYCSTNGLWRAMISYFPVVLLIILRNQSRTRNRTSHANPTDLLEAGTCFNHSYLVYTKCISK